MSREIELHEVLRDRLGAEAAKMLSEAIWNRTDLATKADLKALEARLEGKIQGVEGKIQEVAGNLKGWMLGMFIPVWITNSAMVVALLVKR